MDNTDDPLSSSSPPPGTSQQQPLLRNKISRKSNNNNKSPRQWLQLYCHFLSQSPAHQDKLLKFFQWSAVLLGTMQTRSNNKAEWTIVSNHISWARYVTRLLEGPLAVRDACQTFMSAQRSYCSRLTALALVLYYPLEHVAYYYFQVHQLRKQQQQQQSSSVVSPALRYSAWCCQCWLLSLVTDSLDGLAACGWDATTTTVATGDTSHSRLALARNLLFLLPALEWSELLPTKSRWAVLLRRLTPWLCWTEAVVCLVQAVRVLPPPPYQDETSAESDTDDQAEQNKKDD